MKTKSVQNEGLLFSNPICALPRKSELGIFLQKNDTNAKKGMVINMKRVLTAPQMKRCDSYTIDTIGVPSRELMGRAAKAAYDLIKEENFDTSRVLCLCGTGNNGGDGLAVAMMFHEDGTDVQFLVCGDKSKMTDECRYRYDCLADNGVAELNEIKLDGITLIVDALLGIGLSGNVRDGMSDMICKVNKSGIPVVAIDIPSGINSDTGVVMGCAVNAAVTVSFAYLKPGHIFYPGRTFCGKTYVADIGIGCDGVSDDLTVINAAEDEDIKKMLPVRVPDSHKGTYGRLLVVAGSEGMFGASYFSSLSAYRSGAGLVEVFTSDGNVPLIQTKLPEAIAVGYGETPVQTMRDKLRVADACVIGPGLGQSSVAARLVEEALFSEVPLLIDADALSIIAASDSLKELLRARKSPAVVTPHLGEMARLTGAAISDITADPIKFASDYSKEYGVVCVQKNSVTVIAENDRVNINLTGCSAMAKGGSGDVLTGIIGAFLAAGCDAYDSAVCGVYLHGRAGEIASSHYGEYSVLASDTANCIGEAISSVGL